MNEHDTEADELDEHELDEIFAEAASDPAEPEPEPEHDWDEPLTIVLKKPIVIGKGKAKRVYEEIRLRPLCGDWLRGLGRGSTDVGTLLDLASKSSGVLPAAIGKLAGSDLAKVIGATTSFLEHSLPTG